MHPACIICLRAYIESQNVVSTHCGHIFHQKCIVKWFNRNQTCPDCQYQAYSKPLKQVHLRPVEIKPNDSVQLQEEIERLKIQNRVKDFTIAKLRELLPNYERRTEELTKLNADYQKLRRELHNATRQCASLEQQQRDAERRCRRTQTELERMQKMLNRLPVKLPLVSNVSTPGIITAGHRKLALSLPRPPSADFQNIPKKRPGISAQAIKRKPPQSLLSQVAEIFRDPELYQYMTEPDLDDTFEMGQFPEERPRSPTRQQAGKQRKATGGGVPLHRSAHQL
ncbi:E3 ubiquitin-protein ligase TRAIP-like [Culex pipiens pallens]|uniref:E3 ubiquitin-protein ligase TRAIP-like n=1 Tax=Culex pipiens pallens TaxID=42434 RepID=UPI001954F488|nr:E3 ubiquitin-protein ligase TRAIP-like [Culex pipiens pallens]